MRIQVCLIPASTGTRARSSAVMIPFLRGKNTTAFRVRNGFPCLKPQTFYDMPDVDIADSDTSENKFAYGLEAPIVKTTAVKHKSFGNGIARRFERDIILVSFGKEERN